MSDNVYWKTLNTPLHIVSNDHGHTQKCNFSVLDRTYPFWTNSVLKIKIVSLSWNLVTRLFEYVEFSSDVHFFCFRLEIPFLGKVGQKTQNWQFKLKFFTWNNSNLQNLKVKFTFSISAENTILGQIWCKNSK